MSEDQSVEFGTLEMWEALIDSGTLEMWEARDKEKNARIEALEAERDEAISALKNAQTIPAAWYEKLRVERDVLREVLAFYANRENWRQMSVSEFREKYHSQDPSVSIRGGGREVYAPPGRCLAATELDHGRLARTALNREMKDD